MCKDCTLELAYSEDDWNDLMKREDRVTSMIFEN